MNDYYCKNCKNKVGQWKNYYNLYKINAFCYYIDSKNNKFISFLECENCDKFVGIVCYYVCKICFGKDTIIGEKNLFNFFLKYKKIIKNKYFCIICNNNDFRRQCWFFKELTFYK